MRRGVGWIWLPLILAACASVPEQGSVEVVAIDAPRFCHRAVRSYSDFATIREVHETVVGNDCIDREPMGDVPVLWVASSDLYATPAVAKDGPARNKNLTFEYDFKRGRAEVADTSDTLKSLLAMARADAKTSLRIVGHAAPKEPEELAARRAASLRRWLVKHGVAGERIQIAPNGTGGSRADIVLQPNKG